MALSHTGKERVINHKDLLFPCIAIYCFKPSLQVPTLIFIVNYVFTRHSKDLKVAILGHTLSFGLNGVFVGKTIVYF